MKTLFLGRYDIDGPSSRYRMLQFIPGLSAQGIECQYESFFPVGYVSARFRSKVALIPQMPISYFRRLKAILSSGRFDVLFIEKEGFPYLPSVAEVNRLISKVPFVADYDDAVFEFYDRHPNRIIRIITRNKIAEIMSKAAGVTVGSRYLFEYARKLNENTCLIPTVIDLDRYPSQAPLRKAHEPFIIGWIGSQGTVGYLKEIEKSLDEFCTTHDAQVVIIGGSRIPLNIRSLRWIPWSSETEIDQLSMIDVGIMPLPDTAWAKGKCAFKLVQYMGCWKPVIASPVGENAFVVEHGVNGFLASERSEWLWALNRLYTDRLMATEMGIAGRMKIAKDYSLTTALPKIATAIRKASKR